MLGSLAIPYDKFVFVDFGSGKGRTLFLASEYPFKKIEGVEFSSELHETAVRNIAVFKSSRQRCHCIKSLHMDAVDYPLPSDNLLIYLYNPFGREIMLKVLDNIRKSMGEQPRQVIIVYFNPLSGHLFEQQDFLPFKVQISLPYDWTRQIQRKACVYSNFALNGG